jgi:hypothetical protein
MPEFHRNSPRVFSRRVALPRRGGPAGRAFGFRSARRCLVNPLGDSPRVLREGPAPLNFGSLGRPPFTSRPVNSARLASAFPAKREPSPEHFRSHGRRLLRRSQMPQSNDPNRRGTACCARHRCLATIHPTRTSCPGRCRGEGGRHSVFREFHRNSPRVLS